MRSSRLSISNSSNRYYPLVAIALCLSNCSTPLLTYNTLDVASTVDDLNTRQIIFNLVKTKERQFALPSQVQVTSGSVNAGSAVTPSLSFPITPSISSSVTAATTSVSKTWEGVGASVGGSASDSDTWDINFLQDPQQYRRLRLLYQYGAHQISWGELTCQYPIPEISADQQQSQSQQDGGQKIRRYIRVVGEAANSFIACRPPNVTLVGDNPNPAFLNFPDCIICAFPQKHFDEVFKKYLRSHPNVKIYKGVFVPQFEDYSDNFEYVPVVLNERLVPNSALLSPAASIGQHDKIDWLSVVKDGVDAVPDDARRIGGWGGYTVYVHPVSARSDNAFTGDEHFSEFVLAVMEAVLQPAELSKVGAAVPPVTRSNPQ